jgi:asparagine synthase (glutamine-hydrolysing)
MCGIAGIVAAPDSRLPDLESRLVAMSDAIRHRGPDDSGRVVIRDEGWGGQAGLANRRLSILDVSDAGHQPMCDPATGNRIVHNGEVYNFREIRARLDPDETAWRSNSDTEVVLRAYGSLGTKSLHEFRGMFAFAIWDRPRAQLFVARDRLGVKPLYYYWDGGRLVFASEVRALLASGLVPRRLERRALDDYLTFGSLSDPLTLVRGVKSLPPGHYLIWKDGRLETFPYWTLEAATTGERGSDVHAAARVGELVEQAVALRLISDVPVGVFLSGGIDSGLIAAMAARLAGTRISTFTVGFDDQDRSEAPQARLVAEKYRTAHHELLLTEDEVVSSLPDALGAMDQPSLDGLNTYFVSRETRRAGMKVALSGLGGDELFAGYSTFISVPRLGAAADAFARLPSGLRHAGASLLRGLGHRSDRLDKAAALIEGNGALLHPYFLARMLFTPARQIALLKHPEWCAGSRSHVVEGKHTGRNHVLEHAARLDRVNRVSYLELGHYLPNTLLRDSDAMSMAHGLELRVPFLDHRLVEHVLALPGPPKLDGVRRKPLLLDAAPGLLPPEIAARPKQGFTLPFDRWLRGRLGPEVGRVLSGIGDSALGSIVDPAGVRNVWDAFLAGQTSWSRPWALYVLTRWSERHSLVS